MTIELDGNILAKEIMSHLRDRFASFEKETGKKVTLKILLVGGDEGARIYSQAKLKRAGKLGVDASVLKYGTDTTREELMQTVRDLSEDDSVNGIMVENPLPGGIDFNEVVDSIPYYKDVDGTSTTNQGLIVNRREFLTPATAYACVRIMERYNLRGNVTIVNRSPVVGRPLINMLLNRDYTVSVCHSKTANLMDYTRNADIVVAAVGRPGFFNRDYFTEKSNVIDVGINYTNNRITGDTDYDDLKGFVRSITPVPGGVGPVTATLIFENLLKGASYQLNRSF